LPRPRGRPHDPETTEVRRRAVQLRASGRSAADLPAL